MSARDTLRKGWCPGALRPMLTGDGLLVRLRLSGGIVPAALARATSASTISCRASSTSLRTSVAVSVAMPLISSGVERSPLPFAPVPLP